MNKKLVYKKILLIIGKIDEIQGEIRRGEMTGGSSGINFEDEENREAAMTALESAVVYMDEFEDIIERDEAYKELMKG